MFGSLLASEPNENCGRKYAECRGRICTRWPARQTSHLRSLRLLLGCLNTTLPSPPRSLGAGFGIADDVPPAEAARVVADEALVVHVVPVRPRPDGQPVVQAPGELVARMRVDGLEEAEHDPQVHGQDMQAPRQRAVHDGHADGAEAEEHDLDGRRVLGGHAEGRAVLVVDLVHPAVHGPPVQEAVVPVVPRVLGHEEDGDLRGHGVPVREGDRGGEAEELGDRVEEPDLRQLDGEVGEEDEGGALPLLGGGGELALDRTISAAETPDGDDARTAMARGRETYGLDLVPVEPWYHTDDDPGQGAAKVDDLVHGERHDAGGEDIVLHERVPRRP